MVDTEAQTSNGVRVFISHKHEDMGTALLLHRKLELFGGDRVDCFVSEKIPYGREWFEQIRTNLAEADILILLFTVTDASWDWPLYEVGLATNLQDDEQCRIICLYPPYAQPPEPIKYAQAVQADEEGITDFLYRFFCTSEITGCDPPINPRFNEDRGELVELARQLVVGFGDSEPWSHCFTNFFWLTVDKVPIEEEAIPPEARISPESSAFEIFRLTPNPPGRKAWTWGELLQKISPDDSNNPPRPGSGSSWVSDLGERFYWASRGEILKTMASTVTCMTTGRRYRPLLHRVELKPNGSMEFEVIFVVHDPEAEPGRAAG